jgi:hypothetical protein
MGTVGEHYGFLHMGFRGYLVSEDMGLVFAVAVLPAATTFVRPRSPLTDQAMAEDARIGATGRRRGFADPTPRQANRTSKP